MDYRTEAPEIIKKFLIYHETIKGHSRKTVDEYYLDLRGFFRYMKLCKGLVPRTAELSDVNISDISIDFIKSITISDVYEYLGYLARDKELRYNSPDTSYGLNAKSRARKIATLRSFYKYLSVKMKLIEENPLADMDSPKIMKTLPSFLTLEESQQLLSSVDGPHKERDYCILLLFLSCGLRISEMVGLNLTDVREDHLRILGKGNKIRVVYLSDACKKALDDYLNLRKNTPSADGKAVFLSSRKTRISKSTIHALVKKYLSVAGLDSTKYSAHKLRHTAATLMLRNGVDVRTLQEVLGHENLNTTQIYTHVESDRLRSAAALSPLSDFSPEKDEEDYEDDLDAYDEEDE